MSTWTMDTWLGVFGAGIGVAGLIYAVMTNREKARLENLVAAGLRGLAGNICKIEESANWAYEHYRKMHQFVLQLPDSAQKNEVLTRTQVGLGDASASARMLANLLNDVLVMQQGLFNTKVILHPEEKELMKGRSSQ